VVEILRPDLSRRSVLVPMIVACGLFMEQLDSAIILTALPSIARSLHEPPLRLSLAITSYLLSLAIFIPISGWVADRFGARRVFRSAILTFTFGSLLCAVAQTMLQLVAARILQGIGGALMVPVGRLVILRQVPKNELVSAMSWLVIPALLAPMIGPPLGGLIATVSSWRWIFLMNLPIGVIGYWLVGRYIEDIRTPQPMTLDWRGWLLVAPALAALVFTFESMGKHLIPATTLMASGIAGALLLVAYVAYARGQAAPILDLSLFRLPTFRSSIIGGSLFRLAVGGYILLMPLMLQLAFGRNALESGLVIFTGAIGALALKTTAPAILRRYGFRRLMITTSFLCAAVLIGCGLLRPWMPSVLMSLYLLCGGFVRSLQFTCVNAIAYSDVPHERMSRATSFFSTAQQLSLTMGVCLSTQILSQALAVSGRDHLLPIDFTVAFTVIALLSLLPLLIYVRLSADAGASVSGHRVGALRTE
jgi:EmrB/QacA subfamily drug resistance transporter